MAAPSIRGSTVPVSGYTTASPAGTQVGDLVVCVTWSSFVSGDIIPTLDTDTGNNFVEIRNHAHNDGTTDGRLACAYKIATVGGTQNYTPFINGDGFTRHTGCIVLTAGTYTVATLPPSNSLTQTNNALPDPTSVAGLTGDYLILAIAGWNNSSNAGAITAPTNYNEVWELAGTQLNELSMAERAMTGLSNSTENPGTFGDNITPNGTATMTIAIRAPSILTTSIAADAGSSAVIAASTRIVPAGVIAADGGGVATIAGATVSGGGSVHTTSLAAAGASSAVVAGSTRIALTTVAADGASSAAIAGSTRTLTTSAASVGVSQAAVTATRTTATSLAAAGVSAVAVAGSTVIRSTSAVAAGAGAATIATAAQTHAGAALTLTGAGSIVVVDATRSGAETHTATLSAGGEGAIDALANFYPDRMTPTGNTGIKRKLSFRPRSVW